MRLSHLTVIAILLTTAPAMAHHGWGSYDANRPITIKAKIEHASLGNPHGMLMVSHGGRQWEITLAPASRMLARGAAADVVAAGKEVTAYGYPKRDGTPEMRAEWIEVDGKRFELR